MYARPAAATAAAVLGVSALLLPGPAVATAPSATRPAGRHGEPLVIAHRGASAYAPENTLAAVDLAADMGFAWVENDVQRTKDGELVVIHDDTPGADHRRGTGLPGARAVEGQGLHGRGDRDAGRGQLVRRQVGGGPGADAEAVSEPGRRNGQKLLLEIKKPEALPGHREGDPAGAARSRAGSTAPTSRTGWSSRASARTACKAVHQQRPDITTGFLGTPAVADLPAYAAFTDQINPSHTSISADYVAAVHALKGPHGKRLRVNTWTVNDAAGAGRVDGFGVDGIITNNPDVVRDALG